MSQLQFPLKDYLRDPVDEVALQRVAEAISERGRDRHRGRYRPLAFVAVAAAVVALVALGWHRHSEPGPLLFADGSELVSMESSALGSDVPLSDGSHIRLSPGARIDPLESTGSSFSAIVAHGRADFDVRPGGPRHWVVECGLATIEVVGTSFSCERSARRSRVEVHHGVVLVRGERVPNRAKRLVAGESLELVDEAHSTADGTEPAVSENGQASVVEEDGAGHDLRKAKRHATADRNWRDLARRGRHEDAYAALGAEGVRHEFRRLGVADLLALADVARLSGHPAEAVMPLERVLGEFSSDAQAPLAAFALGRLELDSLGHPHAAASAFRRALALGIPSSLREDVRARLVEAYARSGDATAARQAADSYMEEFPSGRHTQAVLGWLHMK